MQSNEASGSAGLVTGATETGHRYLVWLGDPACGDPTRVGSKAAGLARLAAAGFSVPEYVVLSGAAFVDALSDAVDLSEQQVASRPLPEPVEEALIRVARSFGEAPLAVRSSSVAEDLDGASFAGQYETVLGVHGSDALAAAVRRCWTSAFSERATAYLADRGLGGRAPMAVIVQRQVRADAAGVAFTADPVQGRRGTVVINAVEGLADRLVSGEVTPEEWRVQGEIAQRSPGGEPVLAESTALRLAGLARGVEDLAGCPQDVEWALEGEHLWLLQARPITDLPRDIAPVPVAVDPPDGYWERDVSHFPDPVSPLQRSLLYRHAYDTTPRFLQEFGMLAERIELRDIGGWHYIRIVPRGGKDQRMPPMWLAWVMARVHPAMRRRVGAAREAYRSDKAGEIVDRWYDEWLPELDDRIRALRDVRLGDLTDAELEDHLDAVVRLKEEGIGVHVLVIGAHMVGVYELAQAARELLGWDDARCLDLLSGLSTRSTEPSRRLAELARLAGEKLAERGTALPVTTRALAELLAADDDLAAAMDRYRDDYGHRTLVRDLASPTLAERPDLLLQLMASQLATGYEPGAVDEMNRAQREATLAEARELLRERSAEDRDTFDAALGKAQRAYPMREENVFYTHCAPDGLMRYAALEVARRLVAGGRIDEVDDVFFLEYDELRSAFAGRGDVRAVVERRIGERKWVLAHPGPASFGPRPEDPPSLRFLPRDARHTTEAFLWSDRLDGGRVPEGSSGEEIRGIAASAGQHTGTVRVIMGEDQFGKLRPGDVVVCPITSPAWSVVFPAMGALVTDSGGILNHPAIIAREYRVPAVVATGNATSLLRDGQQVMVDGTSGVVQVID